MALILISKKAWEKKGVKLVRMQDYICIDATGAQSTPLSEEYSRCYTADGFNPGRSVWKNPDEEDELDDDIFSASSGWGSDRPTSFSERQKKALKKWLKSRTFNIALGRMLATIVDYNGKLNVFIIMNKEFYTACAEKMQRYLENKVFRGHLRVYRWKEDLKDSMNMKDILTAPFSQDDVLMMREVLKAIKNAYRDDNITNFERMA